MGLSVLFWNFNSQARDKEAIVARVALRHRIDLLVLVDCTTDADELLAELRRGDAHFEQKPAPLTQFQVFTRFPAAELEPYGADPRLEVWRVRREGMDVLLAAIHYYDRRSTDHFTRLSRCPPHRETLHQAELRAGHTRTMLFGDFNMDPFEPAMIDARSGFGALPSRALARIRSAEADDGLPRFYNPMCSRLGREPSVGPRGTHAYGDGPPGTHYFSKVDDPQNLFWRHYDQVLVRPALFDEFRDEDFRILAHVPGPDGEPVELIRCTGRHWKLTECDHLPLLFRLRPPEEPRHA